jgi:hypothetical protein
LVDRAGSAGMPELVRSGSIPLSSPGSSIKSIY